MVPNSLLHSLENSPSLRSFNDITKVKKEDHFSENYFWKSFKQKVCQLEKKTKMGADENDYIESRP